MSWEAQLAAADRLNAKAAHYGRLAASIIMSLLGLVVIASQVSHGHTIPLWKAIEMVVVFTGAWLLLRVLVHFMLALVWSH